MYKKKRYYFSVIALTLSICSASMAPMRLGMRGLGTTQNQPLLSLLSSVARSHKVGRCFVSHTYAQIFLDQIQQLQTQLQQQNTPIDKEHQKLLRLVIHPPSDFLTNVVSMVSKGESNEEVFVCALDDGFPSESRLLDEGAVIVEKDVFSQKIDHALGVATILVQNTPAIRAYVCKETRLLSQSLSSCKIINYSGADVSIPFSTSSELASFNILPELIRLHLDKKLLVFSSGNWGIPCTSHQKSIDPWVSYYLQSMSNPLIRQKLSITDYIVSGTNEGSGIILVGSLSKSGMLSGFSNTPGKDSRIQQRFLLAPGENIQTLTFEDAISSVSGTSYSAPQVTKAAALLQSQFPQLSIFEVADILLHSALQNWTIHLENSSVSINIVKNLENNTPSFSEKNRRLYINIPFQEELFGMGILNLERASTLAETYLNTQRKVPLKELKTKLPPLSFNSLLESAIHLIDQPFNALDKNTWEHAIIPLALLNFDLITTLSPKDPLISQDWERLWDPEKHSGHLAGQIVKLLLHHNLNIQAEQFFECVVSKSFCAMDLYQCKKIDQTFFSGSFKDRIQTNFEKQLKSANSETLPFLRYFSEK